MEISKTEENFLTFGHSFNSGDLITTLPGIRKVCQDRGKKAIIYQRLNIPADYSHRSPHPVLSDDGIQVCMNASIFKMMKPLIEYQSYVERFELWEGQEVKFNLDVSRQDRQVPLGGAPLQYMSILTYPQLNCDLSIPWLEAEYPYDFGKNIANMYGRKNGWFILVNRTERYRLPYISYYFLKEYQDNIIFSGLSAEHKSFCGEYNLDIPLLTSPDFLFLARAVATSKFLICNQSLTYHIGDGMKKPRVLEVCGDFPNSFPTGANGYPFVLQFALERYVKQLYEK